MNTQQQTRFDATYQNHLTARKLQGKVLTRPSKLMPSPCAAPYFDRVPDDLTTDELNRYYDLIAFRTMGSSSSFGKSASRTADRLSSCA